MYKLYILCLFILSGMVLQAQQPAKTFYFMDNAPIRLGLNPALQPQKGYFSFPLLGSVGLSVVSSNLSVKDFTDIINEENGYLTDKFIDKLKDNNSINTDLSLDLISFGFYSGKGFWNVDIGAKFALNVSAPRSIFEFIRQANQIEEDFTKGNVNYEIQDLQLHLNTFGQIGLGYSRPVMDWLTVGGKIKFLVGLGNMEMKVDEMKVRQENNDWEITTRAHMATSFKGMKLTESQEGYIDNFDFDKPGIGGYGVGIDLGVNAILLKHLNISAAIIDLGFIKWAESATSVASTDETYSFNPEEYEETLSIFDENLFQLRLGEKAPSRRTRLHSTLNLGAEYSFWRNRVGIGLLSSTTFYQPEAYSELTASVNFRPGSWFGAALSYSFLHSDFETFGFGLRFGPIFLATDYMITGSFENIKCANAYLGINFPIGQKNAKYKKAKQQVTAE